MGPFGLLLIFHVLAGSVCLLAGAAAFAAPKRRGWHVRLGEAYHASFVVLLLTSVGMAVLHWATSAYLLYVGLFSYGFALVGYLARKIRWSGWLRWHVRGMLGSYIAIITAVLVVNGSNIPLLEQVPVLVYWVSPTLIGTLVIVRTIGRVEQKL